MKRFFDAGAEVNTGNPPPLILLAMNANQHSPKTVEFARLLIKHGSNPSVITNDDEQTAFEILKAKNSEPEQNKTGLYQLLGQYEAKVLITNAIIKK